MAFDRLFMNYVKRLLFKSYKKRKEFSKKYKICTHSNAKTVSEMDDLDLDVGKRPEKVKVGFLSFPT